MDHSSLFLPSQLFHQKLCILQQRSACLSYNLFCMICCCILSCILGFHRFHLGSLDTFQSEIRDGCMVGIHKTCSMSYLHKDHQCRHLTFTRIHKWSVRIHHCILIHKYSSILLNLQLIFCLIFFSLNGYKLYRTWQWQHQKPNSFHKMISL